MCCGGFTVCLISVELVLQKSNFQCLQQEKRKMVGIVKMFIAEVRHPHQVSRFHLGGGTVRTSGLIIMLGKGIYFPQLLDLGW